MIVLYSHRGQRAALVGHWRGGVLHPLTREEAELFVNVGTLPPIEQREWKRGLDRPMVMEMDENEKRLEAFKEKVAQ